MKARTWIAILAMTALPMAAGADPAPKLAVVTVLTDDFPEMLAFYKDVLGLEVLRLSPDYAEFQNEGLRLHVTTRSNMKAAVGHESYDEKRRGQSFELAFSVKSPQEVDAFYRAVVERGATAIKPPADVPWGQRVAFFADPDGNIHDVFAMLKPADE